MMAFSVMLAAEPAVNGRVGSGAGAGTIEGALILAYRNNPQLNAQRSSARATDENVPTALAGYRPRVTGTSSLTEQYLDNLTKSGTTPGGAALYTQSQGAAAVSSFVGFRENAHKKISVTFSSSERLSSGFASASARPPPGPESGTGAGAG